NARMGKALLAAVLLSLLDACDSKSTPAPPSPRELKARDFSSAMKSIEEEYEKLQADLAAGRPPEEARRRVAAIRTAAERASKLDYRASEAENRDLAFEFRKFLDAAGRLENAAWSGDEGQRAWRRLGTACASCHELYRKD
ncbi:MAG TPA: hypothetical protein VFS19_05395, partial [Planctomycetota bacterium]|nr:hypothetical protein [Planctomycetota bacterium]